MIMRNTYKQYLTILKSYSLRKNHIHKAIACDISVFIRLFVIIDVVLLLLGDILSIGNIQFEVIAHTVLTDVKNIIIIGFCLTILLYIFSKAFLRGANIYVTLRTVFLMAYLFPVIIFL
jgi:hypothetical protein